MKRNIFISQPVLGEAEWQALKEPLNTGWVTQGPKVKEFETSFAKKHQVNHALACTSATTALHLALVTLGIKKGDEVLVPAFTWVATANVVLYCGATPVFTDIDLATFNMDPEDINHRITNKTKAIIPVHLFGLCANMDEIKNAAQGVPIIEDAACAAGASYKGIPSGGLGDIGCFSFHPRKSITTGEGGMITTNNSNYADILDKLRNHGAEISEEQRHHGPKPFILPDFNIMGFNYRMTDLQGAVGVEQLKKLDGFIDERQKWAEFYGQELSTIEWISTPKTDDTNKHGWQSYVLLVNEAKSPHPRNKIMEILQAEGISTRPGTHAVHMLNYYKKKYNLSPDDYPNAKTANDCSMAIPLHNRMSEDDFVYIVDTLKSIK